MPATITLYLIGVWFCVGFFTGVGWALGIGRIRSIIGPLVGGLLLAERWNPASVFMAAAGAALCAAVAALSLSQLTRCIGTGAAEQSSSVAASA